MNKNKPAVLASCLALPEIYLLYAGADKTPQETKELKKQFYK